jgi:hypothetical protein
MDQRKENPENLSKQSTSKGFDDKQTLEALVNLGESANPVPNKPSSKQEVVWPGLEPLSVADTASKIPDSQQYHGPGPILTAHIEPANPVNIPKAAPENPTKRSHHSIISEYKQKHAELYPENQIQVRLSNWKKFTDDWSFEERILFPRASSFTRRAVIFAKNEFTDTMESIIGLGRQTIERPEKTRDEIADLIIDSATLVTKIPGYLTPLSKNYKLYDIAFHSVATANVLSWEVGAKLVDLMGDHLPQVIASNDLGKGTICFLAAEVFAFTAGLAAYPAYNRLRLLPGYLTNLYKKMVKENPQVSDSPVSSVPCEAQSEEMRTARQEEAKNALSKTKKFFNSIKRAGMVSFFGEVPIYATLTYGFHVNPETAFVGSAIFGSALLFLTAKRYMNEPIKIMIRPDGKDQKMKPLEFRANQPVLSYKPMDILRRFYS